MDIRWEARGIDGRLFIVYGATSEEARAKLAQGYCYKRGQQVPIQAGAPVGFTVNDIDDFTPVGLVERGVAR